MLEWFKNWPTPDPYTFIGLGFSVVGTILSFFTIFVSYAQGRRSQKYAVDRLHEKLLGRVSAKRLDEDLLSIQSIQSLARGIQIDTNSPAITEYMIAETIRLTALNLESIYRDTELKKRLLVLNRALEEFDPLGPKLASISARDRMRGYILSLIPISIIPFIIHIALLKIDPQRQIFYLPLVLLTEFALVLLGYRAYTFWRQNNSNRIIKSNFFTANPNSRMDFFIFQAHNKKIRTFWSAIWEEFAFRFFPLLLINIILLFTLGDGAFWSISKKNIKNWFPFIMICDLFWMLFHEYKPLKTYWLKNRLDVAHRNIKLQEMGRLPYSKIAWQTFLSLSKELWVITGNEMYKAYIRYINDIQDKHHRNNKNKNNNKNDY